MKNQNDLEKRVEKIESWFKVTTIAANIFVVFQVSLIVIAYWQYSESKDFNKNQTQVFKEQELTRYSIEAIKKIHEPSFIHSIAILKSEDVNVKSNEYISAFNNVLNTYYVISIIYKNNIANNKIIGDAIQIELSSFIETQGFKDLKDSEFGEDITNMNESINLKK